MNFKFILFVNILLFSCSSLFKKCDYCNLKYNDEDIVYSIESLVSYHQSCQDGYYNTDVKSIDRYYKVDNVTKAEMLIKIIRTQLDKIGLNNPNDVINIKLLKRKDYNNRRGWYRGPAPNFSGWKNNYTITMSNHYDELTFKTYLAKIFTQIWLLDNYDLKIQKKKNAFILLVQDYIYKLDKRAMATQSSYKFEKRNRRSNYLFRKMKNLLDKNGWEEFMLEKLYI